MAAPKAKVPPISIELTDKEAEVVIVALRRFALLSDDTKVARDRAERVARKIEFQL